MFWNYLRQYHYFQSQEKPNHPAQHFKIPNVLAEQLIHEEPLQESNN
ncbi:MAG: Uncharacterised protein [Synechococcus sp. CC9902]|nr:MAG: Uncharacterised protein [Synechococcus sp. CC9902]